jgi:hypothetical protein
VEEEWESYLVVETDDQCGKGIDDVDMDGEDENGER